MRLSLVSLFALLVGCKSYPNYRANHQPRETQKAERSLRSEKSLCGFRGRFSHAGLRTTGGVDFAQLWSAVGEAELKSSLRLHGDFAAKGWHLKGGLSPNVLKADRTIEIQKGVYALKGASLGLQYDGEQIFATAPEHTTFLFPFREVGRVPIKCADLRYMSRPSEKELIAALSELHVSRDRELALPAGETLSLSATPNGTAKTKFEAVDYPRLGFYWLADEGEWQNNMRLEAKVPNAESLSCEEVNYDPGKGR